MKRRSTPFVRRETPQVIRDRKRHRQMLGYYMPKQTAQIARQIAVAPEPVREMVGHAGHAIELWDTCGGREKFAVFDPYDQLVNFAWGRTQALRMVNDLLEHGAISHA